MSANGASEENEMRVDPQRAKELVEGLNHVVQRISAANKSNKNIRLIAVSKLKPASDILALHHPPTSHTHFGENYLQELQAKAACLPPSIQWHFIGALQTNKCKPLAESIPNLWCVSSVDSIKKADALEKGRAGLAAAHPPPPPLPRLRVQVQVNTSGEASKSGVAPGSPAVALCRHVRDACPHLQLAGLMTIGAIARSVASTPETENEDFEALWRVRAVVAEELGVDPEELELSMGMSGDFEAAIAQGSDEVRIGSTIFGERPAKRDAIAATTT